MKASVSIDHKIIHLKSFITSRKIQSLISNESKIFCHTTAPLILDLGNGSLFPPIDRIGHGLIGSKKQAPIRCHPRRQHLIKPSTEPQPRRPELVVGEISEGVEAECIAGVFVGIMLFNDGKVVLERPEPCELLLLRSVDFAVESAPRVEEVGVSGGERREKKEEDGEEFGAVEGHFGKGAGREERGFERGDSVISDGC